MPGPAGRSAPAYTAGTALHSGRPVPLLGYAIGSPVKVWLAAITFFPLPGLLKSEGRAGGKKRLPKNSRHISLPSLRGPLCCQVFPSSPAPPAAWVRQASPFVPPPVPWAGSPPQLDLQALAWRLSLHAPGRCGSRPYVAGVSSGGPGAWPGCRCRCFRHPSRLPAARVHRSPWWARLRLAGLPLQPAESGCDSSGLSLQVPRAGLGRCLRCESGKGGARGRNR